MTNTDRAGFVLAHFGIPYEERAAHRQVDSTGLNGRTHMTPQALRTYRAIYNSLSMEECIAAAERL